MPIIITYLFGAQEIVEGESWKQLDENTPKLGVINLRSIADGHRIIVTKSAVAKVEEIPQAVWDANIEAQKKVKEEQEKARAEVEAKRKSAAAAATLALLRSKTVRGRIGKLFGRKP